jgi:hypothetical protein
MVCNMVLLDAIWRIEPQPITNIMSKDSQRVLD